MIKNYIFDFGNVLAQFYPDKLTEPYVKDAQLQKIVSEVAFDRLYWDKLDSGDITDEQVKQLIMERLPGGEGILACRVFDNWINTMTPVDGMHDLIADIHRSGKGLYLISNISKSFAENCNKVPWIKEYFDQFDGIVLSAVVGKCKPNKDIFEHLLDTYNLKSDECLFVDDSEKNVKGAEAVGIQGYLFDGDTQKLREYLYEQE